MIFRISSENGDQRTACGPAYKGLCLVRVGKGCYRLFHMKSGAGVVGLDGDYHAIRRISADIANLMDWEAYTAKEEILSVPGLGNRIDAIVRSATGDDLMRAGHA